MPVDDRTIPRHLADGAIALAVLAAAFLFRFNTLGGARGGFTDDEFGYLARARQIQGGDLPFRDFNDPGWFLTDITAALAQWLGGYNLRSEALLTVGMLAIGASITFLLARRFAHSATAALVGVALQLALDPRHYNYPKIVLYAVGVACAWAYVARPTRARVCAFAAFVACAFLFRHDHLVYLGLLALTTMAIVHADRPSRAVRDAVVFGLVTAACLTPFFVFLTLNGGVGEYFRVAWVYISRDAERTTFRMPPLALDPVENATGLLYYVLLALPIVAAIVLIRIWRSGGRVAVTSDAARMAPLLILAVTLNAGFMSRGSTNVRLGDVGVTAALVLAWLVSVVFSRDARAAVPHAAVRAVVRVSAVAVLLVTALSANGLAHTWRQLETGGFRGGPASVAARTAEVWNALRASPPAFAGAEGQSRLLSVAAYVHDCTEPTDRLFVLGEYPELYYFADRRFAGGHAWLLPRYYGEPRDQARIVSRLQEARVPIVVTEERGLYDREYRPFFEHLHAYLESAYREAGAVETGEASLLRILVHSELTAVSRYEPLGLPCFRP